MDSVTSQVGVAAPDGLMAIQEKIERDAFLEGKRRLEKALLKAHERGEDGRTPVGQWILRKYILPMAELLATDQGQSRRGRPTKAGPLFKFLTDMDPQYLCAVAARTALGKGLREKQDLTTVAREVGQAIEAEWRWHLWEEIDRNPHNAAGREWQRESAVKKSGWPSANLGNTTYPRSFPKTGP